MRKIHFTTGLFATLFLGVLFVNLALTKTVDDANSDANPYLVSELPFEIGERLIFRLRYGFISAGKAEMKVLGLKNNDYGNYYHIQTTARSTRTFDWVFKVRDVVNSYINAKTLHPIHFEKLLREGNYKADTFVDYFYEDSVAKVKYLRYKDGMKIKKREEYEVKIPPTGVFDALSAFYYIRTLDLKGIDTLYVPAHEKKKVYNLPIAISGPEIVTVKAGKFRCWRLEPALMEEGIFKHEGKLTIWLTDDNLKIPVQMKTKVLVGHITAELIEIKGISKKIPAKLN
ncbi:DUF3108 domain-containing protein [Calditrichota bacterium LG25]